jgi:AAA+ superfamily predicted ATPase
MDNRVVYSKWIKRGTNTFIPTDNSQILPIVDAGMYDLRVAEGIGFYMLKREMYLDDLLEFPSKIHRTVLDSIKEFWKRKAKFKEYGFAFKRGVLLHGKAGSGKSCIISLCAKYVISELQGVVIPLNSQADLDLYAKAIPETFRVIEKERPIVIILEDIEGLCSSPSSETQLLNVLDGLDQLENVVYLATTNYIENLKERIINRPSRFDRRIYVSFLNYEDRMFYFHKKLKESDLKTIDVKKWSRDTDGLSVAHLAELIKSVAIFGSDYDETLAILKEMNEFASLHSSKYEKNGGRMGYTSYEVKYEYPQEEKPASGKLPIHVEPNHHQ